MPRPIARWNPARDAWELEATGLLCEHSDVFSETWPTSGMTRSGVAYPLPPWDAHTCAGVSSSLLPTPDATHGRKTTRTGPLLPGVAEQLLPTRRATDGEKGGPNQRGSSGDLMLPSAVHALMPTPTISDANGIGKHGTGGPDLRTTVDSLLPTPQARDGDRPSTAATETAVKRFAQGKRNLEDAIALLPTPAATDANGARCATANRRAPKPTTTTTGKTLSDFAYLLESTGKSTGPRSGPTNG